MQIYPRRKSLHAGKRIIFALLPFLVVASPLVPAMSGDYSIFRTGLEDFMVVFIPTVAMLFLIPVFVLGSISEKIVAFVVFLPHACIGFAGWEQAVYLFRDSASRGN